MNKDRFFEPNIEKELNPTLVTKGLIYVLDDIRLLLSLYQEVFARKGKIMQELPSLLNEAIKSPWVKFTEYFILAIIAIIIVVDIVLAINGKPEDTISEVIIKVAYGKFSVLAWVWGVLAGHLFLAKSDPILGRPTSIYVLIGLTGVSFLLGLAIQENLIIQVILLSLGIIAGYLLWSQNLLIP